MKRDSIDSSHAIVFAAAASAAAASLSEAMSPSEGGSETSAVGTEGESAKVRSCFTKSLAGSFFPSASRKLI